jgi:hypothetical protein
MSYGFVIFAPTKEAALAAVADKLDEASASEPVNERDRAMAEATIGSMIGLTREFDESEQIEIKANGMNVAAGGGIYTVAISTSVAVVPVT